MAVTSAKIYMDHEKWDDALDVINQGIACDSTHAELHILLGTVQAELQHYAEAEAAFTRAFSLDIETGEEIQKIKKRYYNPLMRDGINAMQSEKPDSAEIYFKNAIALCPEKPDGFIDLGIICYERSDYACAIENFRKANLLDPENESVLKNLALSYSLSDQPDSAMAIYRKMIEKNPDDFDTNTKLASLLLNIGKYDEACSIYDSILTDDIDDVNTLYNAGVAYAQTKQYEKAARSLERVLAITSEDVDAMVNLSMIYLQLKQFEKSIPVLENLTEREPNNPEYWNSLAVAYMQVKRESDAEAAYSKYRELTGEE
jgi:tetratricopeptide (TPR) repeat protein